MMNTTEIAVELNNKCKELGWTWSIRGNVFSITKKIKKNDKASFVAADGEYYNILSLLPTSSPGSIWGTDGGGIGGYSAMQNGVFCMNKSGGNKRVLNQLKKI